MGALHRTPELLKLRVEFCLLEERLQERTVFVGELLKGIHPPAFALQANGDVQVLLIVSQETDAAANHLVDEQSRAGLGEGRPAAADDGYPPG